jgi:hypothetical protein
MARAETKNTTTYVLTLSEQEAGLLTVALRSVGIHDGSFPSDCEGEEKYDAVSDIFSGIWEALSDLHPETRPFEDLRFEILD